MLLLGPVFGFAQLDSLLEVAQELPAGTEKVEVWLDVVDLLKDVDVERGLLYCDSAEQLAESLDYGEGVMLAQYYRASGLSARGENVDALLEIRKALTYVEAQQDTHMMVRCYDRLGSIYTALEMYEPASETLLRGAGLSELSGELRVAAIVYYQLGKTFWLLENNVKSKQYFQQSLQLMEELGDYSLHAPFYSALAASIQKTEPDSAVIIFRQAIDFCREHNTPYYFPSIYNNMGRVLYDLGNKREALDCYYQALNYGHQFNDVALLAELHNNLGDLHIDRNQLDSAAFYINKSLAFAEENQILFNQQRTYQQLSKLNEKRQNYEEAYDYLQKTFVIRDSIYNSNVERQIQINADQFQLERKEKQIAEQELELVQAENRSNRMVTFGVIGLLLIVAVYQWYLYHQQQRKQAAELKLSQEKAESLRLRELDKVKTNFFTNISHELRTPLTLILSPIADVMGEISSRPIRDKLAIVQKNGQRLLNLVNEIMDLSKVEVGKLETHLSDVELTGFVKRIFSAFESLAEIRRIRYRLDIDIAQQYVQLDREKMEKILHNLLSNAIKFTPAEGTVELKLRQEDTQYVFEVRDTGPGMHADDLEQIFDRYYQAQQDSQALQGGTGIGLALVKELAQLMKGDVQVESQVGQGSVFRLTVPFQQIDKAEQEEVGDGKDLLADTFVPSYAPISIAGGKPKVLIVEDHPEMGKYLLELLSDHYQCVLATDGTEALKQLKLNSFDCISSDVMMPNMDGFMLREKINENPEWRQIPFLLLTARHLEDDKIRGLQMGIDDYITKPFSTTELHARIHNLISNKLERSAYQASAEEEPLTVDQSHLAKLEQAVLEQIDNEQFKVEDLATALHYSSKQLGRIIKKHTGMSSVQFILEIRLQKARELLEKRQCASVIEAQYAVGIQSTSYFTRKFTERFGKNPSTFF